LQQIQKSSDAKEIEKTTKELASYRSKRYLTQGQKDRIAEVTKQFPSIPFVAYTALDQEPWTRVLDFSFNLRAAGSTIERSPSARVQSTIGCMTATLKVAVRRAAGELLMTLTEFC
jgi:hypothetical protein